MGDMTIRGIEEVRDIFKNAFKGTTTVGIVCDGGVVLASERRATVGYFIASKAAKKIYQIDDSVGMTTAGIVGDAQTLVRIVSVEARLYKMRRGEPMTIRAITTLLANILNAQRMFPFYTQLLVGGVDRTGPHIFSLDPLGGAIEEREAAVTGSGSPIAYGIIEDRYYKGISLDEGVELAVRALHGAMKRDVASGDDIEAVVIAKDMYKELSREEIDKIRNSIS
ncbi:MAG: 20S proteasome [Candidatus Alkanophagales archaeon MCA70_species_1]|nr:20S proteasome [Candidatus Alkanophaga volatiphilum]